MKKNLRNRGNTGVPVDNNAFVSTQSKNTAVKVSVIVPCYNVEKYLEQCMDSIINQTLKELQIICVNDGSKDGTLAMLKRYAARDARIKIIDKPNSGYGHSMNVGIKAAVGEYIGIIESDDFAEPNMFEALYETAQANSADVVKSNFWFYWSAPECNKLHEYFEKDECGKVVKPGHYDDGSLYNRKPSIWSAIYKRSFLTKNKINFLQTPGASFQDTSFTFKVFSLAERMVFIYDAFVHYRQDNENSSVNNVNKKAFCVCDEYQEIERFLDARPDKRKELAAIEGAALYDTCIWNYENLGIEMRYPFLKRVSPWFNRIINDVGLENIEFRGQWWKTRDINRIANDPMEYHTWRHVERYEHQHNQLTYRTTVTPLNNLSEVTAVQSQKETAPPLFSIIIPVYNVEKYLRACLESVMFQTFGDFEVICVNDGSTDHSLAILEEYAAVDERFIIVNQSKSGSASASRNAGMAASRGQYILFFDADDWVGENTCEILKKEIENRGNPSVVIFGAIPFPEKPKASTWHYEVLTTQDKYYETIDQKTLLTTPYLKVYIWRCCLNKSHLTQRNLLFKPDYKYGEDALFMLEALSNAKRVSVISNKLYHYRHFRPESLMNAVVNTPVAWCTEQLRVLKEMLNVCNCIGVQPSPELLAFCLDFIFGCIDRCPEPEKSINVAQLYEILTQANLSKCITQLADNYQGFWSYMLGVYRNRQKVNSVFYITYRKLRKLIARILPPSRKIFYEHMERVMYGISEQQRQIEELRQWYAKDKVGGVYNELNYAINAQQSHAGQPGVNTQLMLQRLDNLQTEIGCLREELAGTDVIVKL